jgi:transposase
MRVYAHVSDGSRPTQRVRDLITKARTRTLEYEPRPVRETDWSAYDAAMTRELPDVLTLICRFVDAAAENLRPADPVVPAMGRPATPPSDVAKALLAQAYLGKANRVAEGFNDAFGPRLGIATAFSYKTIERGYGNPAVRLLLKEVFRLTNIPVRGLETVFSVDGSGMTTSVRDNYAHARSRQRAADRGQGAWPSAHAPRVYNVAVIGVKYKLLAAWRPTTDAHHKELAQFPHVFAQALENQPEMEMLLGDGLYAGRPQVALVARAGVTPRFLPRRNVTLKRFGVGAWVTMLMDMVRNPQEWFSDYHLRSISETGFSVTNDGVRLRKRLDHRKRTESFLEAVVYNLRRLAQLRYLVNLAPLDESYAC